jgi:hypothetical protein
MVKTLKVQGDRARESRGGGRYEMGQNHTKNLKESKFDSEYE